MGRKKLPYKEGDWFAVPLRDGGYALGIAARVDGKGIVLGYFFTPKYDALPTPDDIGNRQPKHAVLIAIFGDLGFLEGTWKVIRSTEDWDRGKWPIPSFVRVDCISGKAVKVEYSEDNLHEVRNTPIDPISAHGLPEDGMSGSGAVEIHLTKLLSR